MSLRLNKSEKSSWSIEIIAKEKEKNFLLFF